jgi:methyl-accepting chemotaxis protein
MSEKQSRKIKLTRSIKAKLLVIPLIVVFIGVLIMGSVSAYITRDNLLNEMEVNGYARLQEVIDRLEDNKEALETIDNQIQEKLRVAATIVVKNQDQLSNMYLKKLAEDLGVLEINWYDSNAVTLYSTVDSYVGWQPDEGHPVDEFMRSDMQYKDEAIRIDTVSGESKKYSYLKARDGSFVQVGLDAANIQNLTEKFSYQNIVEEIASDEFLEYAIFIDKNYTSVAHSDRELIGFKYTDEGTHTAAIEGKPYSQIYYYEPSEVNVYDVLYPVTIDGEHIGALSIGFSMVNIENAIEKNYLIFALLGLGIFLIIGFILYFFSNKIIKIINQLKSNLEVIASGDFSIKISKKLLKRKDELGIMAASVQETVSTLGATLKEVRMQSQEVNSNADVLAGTSEEMSRSSQELAETIQQVAEGATNQARDLDDIIHSLSELTANIDQVYSELEGVKSETEHAENKAVTGKKEMDTLVTTITEIQGSFNEVASKIENLTDSIQEISGITDLIAGISEQTNLLALNAAIEAARAGEHGKGFAVVADEVRKLAEESSQSAQQISNLVNSIVKETDEVLTTSRKVDASVKEQTKSVNRTEESFGEILNAVENISPLMDRTYHVMDNIINSKEVVMEKVEGISAITEENSAATQQVAAASEEMTASAEEVASTANCLSDVAQTLEDDVSKFIFEK